MRGVILAGGTGSRLLPNTKVTNKHLLPVFDRPMITYSIETLKRSGIVDILMITSEGNAGDFLRFLGSGAEFGVNITYKIQDGAGGIAQALSLAEDFSHSEPLALILGDNIFEDDFSDAVFRFKSGAHIFIKEVEDPERFGVVEVDENGIVKSIVEKPVLPKSNLVQTGFYLYDEQVFDIIRSIEPSERGELEITDVNQKYLEKNQLLASEIFGMWIDAGTHDSLLEASLLAQEAFDPERIKRKKSINMPSAVSAKVHIGIVTHNSEKYIEPCISSLLAQDYSNCEITVFDNASTDKTRSILEENFPSVQVIHSEKNKGFAKGHNTIIAQADADFYLCANIDTLFEGNAVSELVSALEMKPSYGVAGGKMKRWDFSAYKAGETSEGRTNFIDSTGIRIFSSHRFEDRGQGEVDFGQFDTSENVFGISGAAVLYRKKALEDTAFKEDGQKEYFDEAMFMYKEDIDLAYRLQWAGWKAIYTPKSVIYHDRSVARNAKGTLALVKDRVKKSSFINKTSLLNHNILLKKNFSSSYSSHIRGATFWYNVKVFLFVLLFETSSLWAFFRLLGMRRRLKKWKKTMPKRVSQAEIEQFMQQN